MTENVDFKPPHLHQSFVPVQHVAEADTALAALIAGGCDTEDAKRALAASAAIAQGNANASLACMLPPKSGSEDRFCLAALTPEGRVAAFTGSLAVAFPVEADCTGFAQLASMATGRFWSTYSMPGVAGFGSRGWIR